MDLKTLETLLESISTDELLEVLIERASHRALLEVMDENGNKDMATKYALLKDALVLAANIEYGITEE